jgi:small subunit ribosomal protein S7
MSRKKDIYKKRINLDPKFNDLLVGKFINIIMISGKKSISERILYNAFKIIKTNMEKNPISVFKKAIENIKPLVEVKSRRVGGASYQVPIEIRQERQFALAFRWLRDYSRNRTEKTMEKKLASEIIDAFNNRGKSVKKKEDTHKMAEANKAFAYYRW